MVRDGEIGPEEKLRRAEKSARQYKAATFFLALTTICLPIISAVAWEKLGREDAKRQVKQELMQMVKDNGDFNIQTKTDTVYYGDSLMQRGDIFQPQYKTNTTIDSAKSNVIIALDKLNLIQ